MQGEGETSNLMIALEQRNIYMEKILNITKQLTVKAEHSEKREDIQDFQGLEIDFQNLLDIRLESMNKIDKCNLMIKNEMNTYPKETYDVLDSVLSQAFSGEKLPQGFERVQALVADYYDMLSRTKKLDIEAVEKVSKAYAVVKSKILKTQKSK